MMERELTQRLWVSSRFLWVFYLLIPLALAAYASVAHLLESFPEEQGWILLGVVVCTPRFLPWILGTPYFLASSRVQIEGDELVIRRWTKTTRVPLSSEVELAKVRNLPHWFGFDVDPQKASTQNALVFDMMMVLISMFGNPNTREQFLLRWRTSSGRGRSVTFVHPARLVEGKEEFQPGMERLIERLGIGRDEVMG